MVFGAVVLIIRVNGIGLVSGGRVINANNATKAYIHIIDRDCHCDGSSNDGFIAFEVLKKFCRRGRLIRSSRIIISIEGSNAASVRVLVWVGAIHANLSKVVEFITDLIASSYHGIC